MSILARLPHTGDQEDLPTYRKEYTDKMQSWASDATDEAVYTLKLSKEYDRVQEYISFLEGDGWWDRRRPKYLSGFYDNRLEHARYAALSQLTDLRPTIDVRSRVKAFQQQAEACQGVIHYEWYNQDLDLSLVHVVDIAMLFGNGFWKLGASMPGNMTFTPCGPDMVMPIQPAQHIQDSAAVMFRTYKPINYFRSRWPERSAGLEEEAVSPAEYQGTTYGRPPRVDEYTWGQMSPQMKSKIGIKSSYNRPTGTPYPVIELREFWIDDQSINESKRRVLMRDPYIPLDAHNYHYFVDPGQRLYPRKRLVVFAGNRLMWDGPSPYWHGQFPFAMLRLNPTIWSFWGLSKYRNLIPLNKALNEIGAGTLDMCKRALNPQVITKEGGVPKAAWDSYFPNMPGGKLRLGPAGNPASDVRYMDPPPLPSYTFQFGQFCVSEFERLAGSMDSSKLAGKKQVPSGDSIEQMRDMQNTSARLEGRYIEAFLRDTGSMAVSNIFQFYTASRRLRILGADGLSWTDFDFDAGSMVPTGTPPEDHVKNFAIDVAPGSLLGTNKDRNKLMAVQLFKMGAISRTSLLSMLEIGDPQKIEKELMREQQEGIGQTGVGGNKGGGAPRATRGQRNGKDI